MAITALLAPIPKWVLINNEGTVAGGAKLYTYRSLNKIQQKIVYQDAGMTIPYTNPIIFDLNGTEGPFYWTVDSADLSDTYYLEAYDADDNLLWTLDDYAPPGAGGGGNVTTYVPLVNYLANNMFLDHIADTTNPTNTTNLVIAPSNHVGFTPALINPVVGTYGVLGPDIRFVKNNTAATDQISFPLFPLASAPLTGDVTPVDYLRYECTNSPVGETYKSFQFPVSQKVKNLANQAMTFKIWARVTATPVTLTVYVRQYFGSGTAASAEVRTSVGTIALTTTWTSYNVSLTIPSVAGKSIGTPGLQTNDDATYIQLEMPLGSPCDVLFTKPALYLGTIDPSLEFTDYDQTNSITMTARTGDTKITLAPAFSGIGWLFMSDGSIGNIGSGATIMAEGQAFQLYKTLWDGVSDTFAPVSTGRGANATADFLAGKTLTFPRTMGRVLGNYGSGAGLTTRALGTWTGSETHTLTIAEMPAHNHPGSSLFRDLVGSIGVANSIAVNQGVSQFSSLPCVTVASQGGGAAHSIVQPSTFMNVFIKL